ncbi:IclR family transcriptional regulator [Allosalinactinospora lopnorensis]|uniref:IclR family transcriptional regulator n=1 Tax=Allosalinactinospora lopnorensis TaxID=1352348 RepID=UPI000623C9F1|nr:IclR family transcriptional regulator [Allosalinactinospora lopnorensis]
MRKLETVDRALQLLQAFERPGQELTVSALASRLGLHRSNASRFAATLADRGFLERAPGGDAFRLGPEIGRLGMLAMASRDLVVDAREAMVRLARETGETVVLSVLDNGETLNIAQVDGTHLVGARRWTGRRAAPEECSDGKVLLAFGSASPGDQRLSARLRTELDAVRSRGWAFSVGDLEPGLNGVTVPVRDHMGLCVAALTVSGPEYRLSEDKLAELAAAARTAAAEISARLGYVPHAH